MPKPIKRPIEDIQKSCRRTLQIIAESAPAGTTVMLCPANLSFAPCPAALAVEDKEYMVGEAPIMPLPNCVEPEQCFCVYSLRNSPE